jgi:hypothetical protein
MNREQTVAAAKIMMAWVNGKDIEGKKQGENNWGDTTKTGLEPAWDWFLYEYRIKPEPMEIEVWVKDGLPWAFGGDTEEEPNFDSRYIKKKFREVL